MADKGLPLPVSFELLSLAGARVGAGVALADGRVLLTVPSLAVLRALLNNNYGLVFPGGW